MRDVSERERIRLAVHAALRHAAPQAVAEPFDAWRKPGGLQLVHDALDTLIDIVAHAPDAGPDAWHAALRARVCPGCAESLPGGYCPLRGGLCALDTYLPLVGQTIRDELRRGSPPADEHAG